MAPTNVLEIPLSLELSQNNKYYLPNPNKLIGSFKIPNNSQDLQTNHMDHSQNL